MPASPIEEAFAALRTTDTSWNAEIGRGDGNGWVTGDELREASHGPFNDLLVRIGQRTKTTDRRTIAASFALRIGWSSAMAIAPYVQHACVPDIGLDNVAFKFKESTFFERTALLAPRGTVVANDARAIHTSMRTVAAPPELLATLRAALVAQAEPIVDALYRWSGFARRGTWGMLTSSWAAQFTRLSRTPDDQRAMLPVITAFFDGTDVAATMQPRMHPVTCGDTTHLYQRRASCCRFYLLPQGDLCASCPLVPHDERLRRNVEWMQKQAARTTVSSGHS